MNAAPPALAFGSLLRRYRRAAGLTQEELAERAGLSARSLGNLERGVPHRPRKDTLALLADALGLTAPERALLAEAAGRLGPGAPVAAAPTPVTATPLVGRQAELTLLERHLGGEGPPLLVLAGEPGIGKTRLLQAVIPRAVGTGLRVLEGGCQRRGEHNPYAPLLDALRSYLRQRRPVQLRTELAGCAWLVRLLPELADGPIPPLPGWTLPPEQERRLMGEAVLRLLSNVAGPAGTLLVLDDLQWAGADALALLAQVVRSAGEVPLRLVGAYRTTEVGLGDRLSTLLADLAHAGLAARRALDPLGPHQAVQLVDELLAAGQEADRTLRERVAQRTGGVPFFIISCAQELRQRAVDANADVVPWDVAESVRQRMAALSVSARELLGAAAVVGRAVSPTLLVAVSGRSEKTVLEGLDRACSLRLLEEVAGSGYRFAHDVIREVVETDLGAARRQMLHRQVARALDGGLGEPSVDLLAYHYSRSGVADKALHYLEQAADQAAAQQAHVAAEEYYRTLLTLAERLGRRWEAARAWAKLGTLLDTVARCDEALEALERAATLYHVCRALDEEAATVAQIGRVYANKGQPADGLSRLKPALGQLDGQGAARGLAALYAAASRLYHHCGRYADLASAAERAAELARACTDDWLLVEAEIGRSIALSACGQGDEAIAVAEAVIPLAEAAGDLARLSHALHGLAWFHDARAEFDQSRRHLARARTIAERRGDTVLLAMLQGMEGVHALYTGAWEQARTCFEQAAGLSGASGPSRASKEPLIALAQLALLTGAWADMEHFVRESQAITVSNNVERTRRTEEILLAQHALVRGQPRKARARLAPLVATAEDEPFVLCTLLTTMAWAYLDLGDVGHAASVVARALAEARRRQQRLDLAEALWMQARVATHQGCWTQAWQAVEEGLDLTRHIPYPYAEARLLQVAGQIHAATSATGPAREYWQAALAIFRRLGAGPDTVAVERALGDRARL